MELSKLWKIILKDDAIYHGIVRKKRFECHHSVSVFQCSEPPPKLGQFSTQWLEQGRTWQAFAAITIALKGRFKATREDQRPARWEHPFSSIKSLHFCLIITGDAYTLQQVADLLISVYMLTALFQLLALGVSQTLWLQAVCSACLFPTHADSDGSGSLTPEDTFLLSFLMFKGLVQKLLPFFLSIYVLKDLVFVI